LKLDRDLLSRLRPYLIIPKKNTIKKKSLNLRWRHQKRLQQVSGYKTGAYTGSPWKGYQRVAITRGRHFQTGLLIEKDPGEQPWNDHLVGYIETDHLPGQARLLVGNFRAEMGQGLVLWGPYGLYKGADPVAPVKKRSRGILGYTYSDENRYLTGGAIESRIRKIHLTVYASHTRLDASINSDETVTSFPASGLHRTESEVNKKNRLHETLVGGRVAYSKSWGTLGATGWWSRYSREVKREDPTRYRFAFDGEQNDVVGIDYDLFLGRFNLVGEIARSRSNGWALIANSIADLGKTSLVLSYRRYDPNFQNPHSHNFGSDQVCNEEGVYIGFAGKITPSTRISFYYDLFQKPWRTYSTPVPTRGDDLFTEFEQKIISTLSMTLRTRLRREENLEKGINPPGQEIDLLQDRIHYLLRFGLRFRPSPRFRLRNRLETVKVFYPEVRGENASPSREETGILFYQDMRIRPMKRLTLSARWILFSTDSYDSRIYEFENDLPGVLTCQPLYEKGTRWYILLQWQPVTFLRLTAKFTTTTHNGVSSWSSGYDEFPGDTDRQLGIQADLKF